MVFSQQLTEYFSDYRDSRRLLSQISIVCFETVQMGCCFGSQVLRVAGLWQVLVLDTNIQ